MSYVDLGKVKPGTNLFVPFHTFDSNDPSASVTITGLAVTDIEVYKDASMTQRASDSGYALVDTDGIDLDTTTGIHGVTIDLSDNTTAGFWAAGSDYVVVIASITVDAAVVNFIPVRFRIGYDGALHETTIAVYTSTDNFTLTAGSADDDAYNGWLCLAHDVASAVQVQIGVVEDYTGSTKTINLKADPGVFTMTAADNISLFPPMLTATTPGTTLDITATGGAGIDWANVESPTTSVSLSNTTVNATFTDDAKIASGTAQAATSTTLQLAAGETFADSEVVGATLVITGGSTGVGQARVVTGYTGATDTATVDTWTTTPTGTITYSLYASPPSSSTNPINANTIQVGGTTQTAGDLAALITTLDTVADGIKAVTDLLPDAGALNDLAAILTDTGTTLPATLATAQADLDTITGSDGVTLATAQANYAPATAASVAALNDVSVADILTTQMTESYAADGAAPTIAQALMLIQQTLGEFSISGTTLTVKQVNGSTTAATFTLDDATTPTSITRAT